MFLRLVILIGFVIGIAASASAQDDQASRVTWKPSYSGSCQNCSLIGQQMPYWDLTGAHYGGADLSYASLHGAMANGAYFTAIRGSHSDFSRAKLRNSHLSGAVLDHCRLIGIEAAGADFSSANLDRADMREAQLIGANLNGSILTNSLALSTDFSGANASGAIFDFATLRGAIFDGALLSTASFVEADVANAKFRNARFHGANMARMINFGSADFTGACRSEATLLPPGLVLPLCEDAAPEPRLIEAP
ncbi:MAG: pentapeptide repeat-containing protein [Pseudomonadota bacterium]